FLLPAATNGKNPRVSLRSAPNVHARALSGNTRCADDLQLRATIVRSVDTRELRGQILSDRGAVRSQALPEPGYESAGARLDCHPRMPAIRYRRSVRQQSRADSATCHPS